VTTVELQQLRACVAIGEQLHFGRAAAALHLSQPALSQQIKRLERELGFALFRRGPRAVEATAAGQTFLDGARQLLADLEHTVALAARTAAGQRGELRIGYIGAELFTVVPALIAALRAHAPDVALSLVEARSRDQLAGLADGRLDIALIHQPAQPVDTIRVLPLLTEEVGIALPEGHPLCATDRLTLRQLADEPFILFPRESEPDTYQRVFQGCAANGFVPNVAHEAAGTQTILGLVACGLGVAFVSASVMAGLGWAGVAYRRLAPDPPVLTTALAYRPDNVNPCLPVVLHAAESLFPQR
jgi:DNA-binding transcriptional LysR family regulator